MEIRLEHMEYIARVSLIERMAGLLLECGSVDPDTDHNVLCTKVAEALDEAEGNGIKSERLMGMFVILRISDRVDPFAVPKYAAVLRDETLEEDDKAHLLQMIRLGLL